MIETWEPGPEPGTQSGGALYLCFWLGPQTYALPVEQVREIRATGAWSTLPGSPPWVLGVMNLRGLVIPLYDLRMRFSSAPAAPGAVPVLVVVAAGGKRAGLMVDGVMDVTEIAPECVRPRGGGSSPEARCVTGVASLDDSVVIVLDAAALLNADLPGADCRALDARPMEGEHDVAMVR
jgi:purine-binding chemotaxis protein CheW